MLSKVIAAHTFCLLVLEIKLRQFVLWTTLIAGWSFICAVVVGNPAILDTDKRGPFRTRVVIKMHYCSLISLLDGISGYWCWITDGYKVERITYALICTWLISLAHYTLQIGLCNCTPKPFQIG